MKKLWRKPLTRGIVVAFLVLVYLALTVSPANQMENIVVKELVGGLIPLGTLLLLWIVGRRIVGENYDFGLRREGFLTGLIIAAAGLIFVASNLYEAMDSMAAPDRMVMGAVESLYPGLHEEVILRALLLGCMFLQWKDKKHGLYVSLFASALIFGCLHFVNLTAPDSIPLNVYLQVFYATAVGVLFGAAFLRSRNLWSVFLIHFLIDFTNSLDTAGETAAGTDGIVFAFVASVIFFAVGLWSVRKAKHEEIKQVWDLQKKLEDIPVEA